MFIKFLSNLPISIFLSLIFSKVFVVFRNSSDSWKSSYSLLLDSIFLSIVVPSSVNSKSLSCLSFLSVSFSLNIIKSSLHAIFLLISDSLTDKILVTCFSNDDKLSNSFFNLFSCFRMNSFSILLWESPTCPNLLINNSKLFLNLTAFS